MHHRHSRQNRLLAVLVLFFSSWAFSASERQPTAYDLQVNIEPAKGAIRVRARVDMSLDSAGSTTFKFNLHETFAVKKLQVDGKDATFTSAPLEAPLLPASRSFIVTLPPGPTGNRVRMDMEYEGRMKSLPEFGASPDWKHSLDDQINSRMVELASYSSWYPQFTFGQPLQVEMELSLPQGWISICSGKKLGDRVEQGRVITRWSSPKDVDIVILASPSYKEKSVSQSGVHIEIYHTQMPEAFIEREISQIAGVVQLYTARLGETNIPAGTVRQVYSPKRKGQGKAGIARPGMIVTSEGLTLDALAKDPKFSLFQGIAHEIAHSWWNFGAGQGDWINEAFAEYFSAIAVEQFSSEEEFRAVLEDYRKQVRELPVSAPPLATVPLSNDEVGFVVRYYKGALMLHRFREVLGDKKFFQASRDFFQTYRGRPAGTAEFRGFWRGQLADEEKLVDTWLDSTGGLPDAGQKQAARAHEIQSRTL